jgi:hypothetical protein
MNLFSSKKQKSIQIPIEIDLIRACAQMEMNEAEASWIDVLLKADLDWRVVHMLANHHRVLPLVYRTLYTHFREQVPEEVLSEMRMAYQTNAARNLFLTDELIKVLGWLQAEEIDVFPIKGPVLAKCVYGDVNLRQFDDLDLLVREGDVARVSELLMDHGYSAIVASVGQEAETTLREEGECGYASPCGLYQVDVHWQMAPRSFLDLDHEGLWERSELVTLNGKNLQIFSPEDMLLLLCIHGMRHLWARHAWIVDLIQLLHTHPELDWDKVFDRGRPLQVERFLNVGLLLGVWYNGLTLPEWVSNQIQADQVARKLVKDLQTSPEFHLPQEPSLMRLAFMNTRARERLIDKARYFVGHLFSPGLEDWSLIRMPARGNIFYPFLRPVRLLMEYGLKPLAKKNNNQGAALPLEEGECVEIV